MNTKITTETTMTFSRVHPAIRRYFARGYNVNQSLSSYALHNWIGMFTGDDLYHEVLTESRWDELEVTLNECAEFMNKYEDGVREGVDLYTIIGM